ncbi:uncharacterized protein rab11fip1a isoform X2 [Takifugu flavidus]|uniref:uncharacterized protein rab11fip1a isoform X2 n=1 Tax=Takifugu flavidus TaxID=433684 RepID=UPI0025442D37|nr:uncharacterized protein rab11fip1a isoform X2 [Takifugu flavidus]
MSLAAQSQMWFPTNVQVAKDKFSTSVAEKSVSPVWKEEASFGLPLFHSSNAERCTLYITAMHRAHVGLDKFLGQAVINLLELFDNKSRKKTDWFKLVDKAGKDDKPRGEVLLDIQFMRNNMSASMFDLSMQDKRRSHISKLKDKVRRKKKDGFTDSASAIVSPVSQIFTDSEGETDTQSLSQSSGVKKKSKLKTLFAPKSNLQRNISQSLSTLRTHPEKSSDLTSNHSSDLSVDSPEVKKTFKLLGHKRTASSDSKTSQGPVSLLGCSKQSNSDLNNLCINGSHLFIEDTKSGSTVSLNSIGQDSVEDVLKHNRHASCVRSDKMILEQQCHLQQEEKSEGEKRCIAEAKRLEEEEKCKLEASRLKEEKENRSREEGEKKRCISEDETQRKKWREEEEKIRKLAEECKMSDLAENPRLEEECHREEEQRQQEEISMSERLTSLFGIVRKKKEELQQDIKDEPPTQAPVSDYSLPISQYLTNPFEDIPLNSVQVGTFVSQKADIGHQDRSAMVFLNRTAKVSAVKPSVDSTLGPPNIHITPFGSLCDSNKSISSVKSSVSMAEKKRALLPPSYQAQGTSNGGNPMKVKEINNPVYEEGETSQRIKKNTLPLPDYESLFPQRRHAVQGHSQWDHVIAEVNQKHIDTSPKFLGKEMSVDGPEDHDPTMSSPQQSNPALRYCPTKPQDTKSTTSRKEASQITRQSGTPPHPHPTPGSSQRHNQGFAQSPIGPSSSTVQRPVNTSASSRESVSARMRDETVKVLQSSLPQQIDQLNALEAQASENQINTHLTLKKNAPTAKPRQKTNGNQLTQEQDSTAEVDFSPASSLPSNTSMSGTDNNCPWTENFAVFDPFPSTDLLSKDPWTQLTNNYQDPFTGGGQKEEKLEDCGMTVEDLNDIFSQNTPVDECKKDSTQSSPSFKRLPNQTIAATTQSNKMCKSPETSTPITRSDHNRSARNTKNESGSQKPQADEKTLNTDGRRENPVGTESLFFIPPRTISDSHQQVIMEEPMEYQSENGSSGKMPLRAWVSPSEVQPVSAQNSSGSGLMIFPRRSHPVKPMNSQTESQHPLSTPAVKEIRVQDSTPGKIQMTDSESQPYTQLTQEELITLVVKQQSDLSRKDAKIIQLEEYIDNLLVRVIEEKPSILQCLQALK